MTFLAVNIATNYVAPVVVGAVTHCASTCVANFGVRFTACAGAHLVGRLADQGLANTLGLATLRHGTNPFSWLSIHMFGADPAWGGHAIGGDYGAGFDDQNQGRFFMARENNLNKLDSTVEGLAVRFISKGYTAMGTLNFLERCYIPAPLALFPSIITAYVMPTIKFRFDQDEAMGLLRDPTLPCACSTNQKISPLKIGILGTVYEAFTLKTFSRISENKMRVITGVAQLALAFVATYFFLLNCSAILLAHKISIIASVALAVI